MEMDNVSLDKELVESFNEVYFRFKLKFYQSMFEQIKNRELTLSAVETFCIEIIYAMGNPTVTEFADFVRISSPNAAYKINSLINKGYLRKVQSEHDKREFHLEVTEKYLNYYNLSASYMKTVVSRTGEKLSAEDRDKLIEILKIMSGEMMPELANIGPIKI